MLGMKDLWGRFIPSPIWTPMIRELCSLWMSGHFHMVWCNVTSWGAPTRIKFFLVDTRVPGPDMSGGAWLYYSLCSSIRSERYSCGIWVCCETLKAASYFFCGVRGGHIIVGRLILATLCSLQLVDRIQLSYMSRLCWWSNRCLILEFVFV